jgi:ABC-type glycerol-3-phosphate transport system permease component
VKPRTLPLTQLGLLFGLGVLLVLVFLPILYLLVFSFKNNAQIFASFWGPPYAWMWVNYAIGWGAIQRFLLNSVWLALASTAITVVASALAGIIIRPRML